MSGNVTFISHGDGKCYTVNMRGKSFPVFLDVTKAQYEIKGNLPKDVKKSPDEFIAWFIKKMAFCFENKKFQKIN